jgi:osmotically-inducible protein OsmY
VRSPTNPGSDDGRVVLRGSVVNLVQRAEAVRTARGVPGVRAVDDQLRTRLGGADHGADAKTEAAVLDALILDDAVPAYGLDVDVDGGKVTLSGAVDIASERDAAERIALRVPGVSEVRNRLKVWRGYAKPARSELGGSTRLSWLRAVMSSLLKTLRRW